MNSIKPSVTVEESGDTENPLFAQLRSSVGRCHKVGARVQHQGRAYALHS